MASLTQVVLNNFGLSGVKTKTFSLSGSAVLNGRAGNYMLDESDAAAVAQNSDGRDAQISSWLGTPIWADVRLFPPGREDLILETVLLTVSARNNIVSTPVQGRRGTIKEYINAGDFDVNIKGAIVGRFRGVYPETLVRDLLSVLKQEASIRIVSDYLRMFDVYELAVTDYSFPQNEGFQNVQLFEINALSDDPVELILEEDV